MIIKRQKKSILSSRVLLILLIICAAFLSAFLGQVAINLLTGSPSLLPEQRLVIRQSQDVFTLARGIAEDVQSRESDGFVQFYTQQIDNVNAPVGQGIILTADGWMLTVASPENVHWQWVRLESGELLPVTKTVQDPSSSLLFVKATGSDLQPVTLADKFSLDTWAPKLAFGYARQHELVSVNGEKIRSSAYLSSDQINRYYQLDGGETGQALYNEKGEIIGLIDASGTQPLALKVDDIRSDMDQVLRSGMIVRPSLAIQYVDLSSRAYSESVSHRLTAGALLTNAIQSAQPTVLAPSSAAYKAGLRLQDVIVSVNGTPINHMRGLSEFVLQAKPADKLELGVLRSGKTVTISLSLGQMSSK